MSFPIWYSPPPPRHYQLMYAQNIIIIYIVYIIVYISIHVSYGEMSLQTQMPMQVFLCLSVCTSHHVTSVISSGEKPMSVNSSYLQALHVTGQVVYSGSQIISHALNCLWGEVAEALWLPWRRKLKKKKHPITSFHAGCLSVIFGSDWSRAARREREADIGSADGGRWRYVSMLHFGRPWWTADWSACGWRE